jgi:EAL domain-containing protein (putative c-di-GMP-specific phosphodiesterase class I)
MASRVLGEHRPEGIVTIAIGVGASLVAVLASTAGFVVAPVAFVALSWLTWRAARRHVDCDRTTWNIIAGGVLAAAVMAAAWGAAHAGHATSSSWRAGLAAGSLSLILFAGAGARVARPMLAARVIAVPAFVALAAFMLIAMAWQWNAVTTRHPRLHLQAIVPAALVTGSAALLISFALAQTAFTTLRRPTERLIFASATLYGVGSAISALASPPTLHSSSSVLMNTLLPSTVVAFAAQTPGMGLVGKRLIDISDRRLSSVAPSAIVATLVADAILVSAMTYARPTLSVVLVLVLVVVVQAALLGAAVAYALNTSSSGKVVRMAQRRRVGNAVAQGQIVAQYQPIVRSADLAIVGFETLARWDDPIRGLMPAHDFVPAADRAGLLASIDRSMIHAAAGALHDLFGGRNLVHPILTVNVHPRRLEEIDFALDLKRDLEKHGLDPDGILLEVTESAAITDWVRVNESVRLLEKMGVGIAIDDFGAGHANFDFLVKFEPHLVKLDRSLIEAAMTSERSKAVVRACIDAARAAGAEVLAEGISDSAWIPELQKLGFDYFQGNVFGGAQSLDDLRSQQ